MNKAEVSTGPAYQIQVFRTGACRIIGKYAFRHIWHDTDHLFNIYLSVISGNGIHALVDTGMESVAEMNRGAGFLMTELITQEPEEATLSILRRVGLDVQDISYVFLTHCHYDHCSNLGLFPNATVVIPAKAWAAWHNDPEKRRYLHAGFFEQMEALWAQGKVCLLDEGVVRPGIGVRWVGGHSVCSQFIYVNTAKGVALFTGDTVQMYSNLAQNEIIGICDSEEECWQAIDIARRDADIFLPGHDPRVLAEHPEGRVA